MSERRLAGWSGAAFVVTLVIQFLLAPAPPDIDASGSEIRDYLVDNRSGILAHGLLQVIGLVFAVVFFVGVANMVRSARQGALWGRVVLVAATVLGATVSVGQAVFNAPLWIDGNAETMSDDLTRTVWSFAYRMYGAGAPAIALIARPCRSSSATLAPELALRRCRKRRRSLQLQRSSWYAPGT